MTSTALVSQEEGRALMAKQAYLALGPTRTPKELSEQIGISAATLRGWIKKYGWDEAAKEYDRRELEAVNEARRAKRAKEWEDRVDEHLFIARFLRQKGFEYFKDRDIEATLDSAGRTVIAGMNPQHARLALDMIRYADETERRDLGEPTERIEISGADGGAIRLEQFSLQVMAALKQQKEWRASQQMPALDDADPLGEFGL